MALVLGLSGWLTGLLIVGFIMVCVLMVLTVLIQKPQGGGLASAFGGGGAGSGQTAFGTKTGDALTIFTIIVFGLYVAFAVALNYASRPSAQPTVIGPAPGTEPEPASTPADGTPAAPGTNTAPAPTNTAPSPAPATTGATPTPANSAPSPAPVTPPPATPPPANPEPSNPTSPAPATSPAPGGGQ